MKLTVSELIEQILLAINDIPFEYKGKDGFIVPFYEENSIGAVMRFENNETSEIYGIDKIIDFKFIDGKSLKEVCDEIIFF